MIYLVCVMCGIQGLDAYIGCNIHACTSCYNRRLLVLGRLLVLVWFCRHKPKTKILQEKLQRSACAIASVLLPALRFVSSLLSVVDYKLHTNEYMHI